MSRYLRIVGTGASFALFGIGSLVVGLVLFPAIALTQASEGRELKAQRIIHWTFRLFRDFMHLVGVVDVEVRNRERLETDQPLLIVANHPTLIDFVLIGALIPQLDCVVKRSHWSHPALGGVMRGAGYVPNDTGARTVADCESRIRAGRNLVLFPEGTRSPRGELGEFQRGAAHVALASGVDAVPVTVRCEPPGLMRGQSWYDVPPRRMQFTLDIGEPISVGRVEASRARAARSLTRNYRQHFQNRLGLS